MPPERMKRQVALKVRIIDLLEGTYVKEEGWEPNYVKLPDLRKCSRANIIGVIISKTENSAIIDDGTSSITTRAFEEMPMLDKVTIGDVVLVIGRPREYNENKYILPEIIRKIKNQKWVTVRQQELALIEKEHPKVETVKPVPPTESVTEEVFEETVKVKLPAEKLQTPTPEKEKKVAEAQTPELPKDPHQEVIDIIRKLDTGSGAEIEELTSQSKINNTDAIIESLLREGEVFELKPGRLKVLE